MVLEAAINGRADALVTYIVADFAGPAERFRISVLRPGELPLTVELFHQLAFFILSCKPISYCRFKRIDVHIL